MEALKFSSNDSVSRSNVSFSDIWESSFIISDLDVLATYCDFSVNNENKEIYINELWNRPEIDGFIVKLATYIDGYKVINKTKKGGHFGLTFKSVTGNEILTIKELSNYFDFSVDSENFTIILTKRIKDNNPKLPNIINNYHIIDSCVI